MQENLSIIQCILKYLCMSKLLSKCTCIVIFNISSLKEHQMFNRKECANSIKKYHAVRKIWLVCRVITIKFPSSDFPSKQEDWAREARGGGGLRQIRSRSISSRQVVRLLSSPASTKEVGFNDSSLKKCGPEQGFRSKCSLGVILCLRIYYVKICII